MQTNVVDYKKLEIPEQATLYDEIYYIYTIDSKIYIGYRTMPWGDSIGVWRLLGTPIRLQDTDIKNVYRMRYVKNDSYLINNIKNLIDYLVYIEEFR